MSCEHVVSVEPAGVHLEGFRAPAVRFRAVCSCAWRSRPCMKRGDAEVAGIEHAVGHVPTLKPKRPRETGFFG